MGTRFELVLEHASMGEAGLRALGEAVLDEVRWWHDALNAFDPRSTLGTLARRAGIGEWTTLDQRLLSALRYAAHIGRLSDGAFDVLWRSRAALPHATIECGEACARLSHAGQVVDLGSIAKGLALDGACEVLRREGGDRGFRWLLHGGTSSVLAVGAWAVALAPLDAQDGSAGRLRRLALENAHLSVSSTHARAHIVHGSTSELVTPRRVAIRVRLGGAIEERTRWRVGEGVLAEAWSTALLVSPGLAVPEGVEILAGA